MNAKDAISTNPMTDDEIRAAVQRVIASSSLRRSPRLVSFLCFVVEATLAGQADRIKGYWIAVEALGRNEDFDPETSPIVRVEAGRLRHALQVYYAGSGRHDPIVIELPLGRYVPTFSRRTSDYGLKAFGDYRGWLIAVRDFLAGVPRRQPELNSPRTGATRGHRLPPPNQRASSAWLSGRTPTARVQ